MAIKKISEFASTTPTASDKILIEQNGAGKSCNIGDLGTNVDLLWTNASPSSAFTSQTILVDLTPYNLIEIYFRVEPSDEKTYDSLIINTPGSTHIVSGALYSNLKTAMRYYTIYTNRIQIGVGYVLNSYDKYAENNDALIPYKIFGVK